MAIQVFPEFVSYNPTFLLKQWTLDELMIGLSSGHHGRHQNIPASKMNFFSSKDFFLLYLETAFL